MTGSTTRPENARFRTEVARERAAKEAAAAAYAESVATWDAWLDSLPCDDAALAALRAGAAGGDALLAEFCDNALAGNVRARRECAYVIACGAAS